ncbi:MAG: phenylalanine--tRNA ligase subunit alpha [Gemmatimonadales bacterium]|nr:MAG: phenylalanine--tRNA ligase subunit alpha [Gemmatimonadales bacterium]
MSGTQSLIDALHALGDEALSAVSDASGPGELETVRVRYLGRKEGRISGVLRRVGEIPAEDRPALGAEANRVKAALEEALDARAGEFAGTGSGNEAGPAAPVRDRTGSSPAGDGGQGPGTRRGVLDLTLPGRTTFPGGRHPITLVVDELWEIFRGMGFTRARGPEAETEWYNFEALNTPLDHPAADEQDTLYLKGGNLLRSHTSPVQVRVMQDHEPPIRILAPGMVYRRDTYDPTHAPAFLQLEGLVVDEGISFVDLKATLAEFARRYWGPGTQIRFRPSFFPFTEPSAEVDVKRVYTDEDGVERETDWLEIMGAGMVDPAVFEACGIDPERYTGFAFGMGPGRIGMLKYGIPDIRAFFENDVRFLSQFADR